VTDLELTDRILGQGKAPVRAIEAPGAIQHSGPFESTGAPPSGPGAEIPLCREAELKRRGDFHEG
jgi:hypothetical protein